MARQPRFVRQRLLRLLGWTLASVATRVPARLRRRGGTGIVESLSPEVQATLRRDGMEPVPELLSGPPVRRVRLPLRTRGWLVTGYDEVRQVLADTYTFSNDFGHLIGRPGVGRELDPGGLGLSDPPYHTELRRLLAPELTVRRTAARRPEIERVVAEQLDELARRADAHGRVDLVAHFARPVPWRVICDLLGIEEHDRRVLLGLADDRFDLETGIIGPLSLVTDWTLHLRDLVARSRTDPLPGLIGDLTTRAGEQLDDAQLAGAVDGLIVGGLETTTSMLALGALALMQDPAGFEAMLDDSTPVRPQVDALLRRLSVVQVAFPRFALADAHVGGVTVRPDDVVICSLSAANHDGHGRSGQHLSFGHGVHRCLGAELARLELECALPALVRRYSRLRVAVPDDEIEFHRLFAVFGVRELPVVLGPAADAV